MRTSDTNASVDIDKNGMVLKKEGLNQPDNGEKNSLNGIAVVSIVLVIFVILLIALRRRRK